MKPPKKIRFKVSLSMLVPWRFLDPEVELPLSEYVTEKSTYDVSPLQL